MVGRIPPHDLVAERALLGCCLLDPESLAAIDGLVAASDFYKDANAMIFEAIGKVAARGDGVDTTLLRSHLVVTAKLERVGGDDYLHALTDTIPTVALAEGYAKRIRDLATVRKVIHAGHEISAEGYGDGSDDVADYLERAERKISRATERKGAGIQLKSFGDALGRSYTEIAERARTKQEIEGHTCGLTAWDKFMSGWVGGEVTVIAGRPGMGKSAFANRVRIGVARSTGLPVLSFELEMTGEQNARRAMAAEAGVNLRRVRAARFEGDDLSALAKAANDLAALPLFYSDDCPISITQLRRYAVQAKRQLKQDLALIVVDYLQLVEGDGRASNRDTEIGQVTRGLKMMAKELQVPVLALSQLNRGLESRPNKRPTMGDLRESGNIEQDADNIAFIYRDEVYHPDSKDKGIAEVIVAKQRQGANATLRFAWTKEYTRFENLKEWEQEGMF